MERKKAHNSKLTIEDDIEICKQYDSKEKNSVQLAKEYGVSPPSIRQALRKYGVKIRKRDQWGKNNHMFNIKSNEHPSWKGGIIFRNGYRMLRDKKHPHNMTGYYYEHRLVMEKELCRYLESYEMVHHKDGDKLNNSIENLELVGSRSAHLKMHNAERKRDEYGRFQ
ncbi:MAG: HNH endonuclease [Ignavibacteriales bacterium]|nr:HNH endonuclease [Ignavibacteriales bacterium]